MMTMERKKMISAKMKSKKDEYSMGGSREKIRSCAVSLVRDIVSRNNLGYKVKVDGEWYELAVHVCEPPDTDDTIVDSDEI